jgi:integrase
VAPEVALEMLDALPYPDKAIWATAFFGGLRRGELWGLRPEDIDRGEGIIRVRHNEDAQNGRVDPKSRAGIRPVPITPMLAEILDEYEQIRGPVIEGERYFPGPRGGRFSYSCLLERFDKLWTEAGFEVISPHDARHSFASFLIASGANAKEIQTYIGHSSITVTFDRYGHLFPGNEAEAATRVDTYLRRCVPDCVPDDLESS